MINMDINVIYITTSCSKNVFSMLQEKKINRDVPQAQKYHRLLIEGIAKNVKKDVNVITAYPTNREWSKKIFFPGYKERISNIKYNYLPFLNMPIFRQIGLYFSTNRAVKENIFKNRRNVVIICDIWNQTFSKAARKMGRKYNIPVIGIVTDVPGHRSGAYKVRKRNLKYIIDSYIEEKSVRDMGKYDAYLLLTKDMNRVVNPMGKPAIVLEGHADTSMKEMNYCKKNGFPKVMMYAGTIHEEYAIPEIVNVFLEGKYSGWEFHIYGRGNYEGKLENIARENSNIIFHGLAANEEIIKAQQEADLIINPRPIKDDFVKYSFPSKTLEAMASGTPFLTTKLPGIPDEYFNYVYLFDTADKDGYKKALDNILNKSQKELQEKGEAAKKFVLKNKNNVVQASKLCLFIQEQLLRE